MEEIEEKEILLDIRDLKTYFKTEAGTAKAIDGISFKVYKDEILGIVGESGSGKSVTSLSILNLIPNPPGFNAGGSIFYKGQNLLKLSYRALQRIRGKEISMIFQEPMTSLNPVLKIKTQMIETLLTHNSNMSKAEALALSVSMLKRVGIPEAEKRINNYPFQYSGGMIQRVMIAMMLLNNPSLLIADEPTTALDVTIQAQILDLMKEIKNEKKESSIILITHDLAVVAEICDRVIVMYCGKVQEIATTVEIFQNPLHPYTIGLKNSIPVLGEKKEKLDTIPGMVPSILNLPEGCKFCTRCPFALDICKNIEPEIQEIESNHFVRCHKYNEQYKDEFRGKNE